MELTQAVADLKGPVYMVWDSIGYDAEELCDGDNECAVEMCIDAGRLTMYANDAAAVFCVEPSAHWNPLGVTLMLYGLMKLPFSSNTHKFPFALNVNLPAEVKNPDVKSPCVTCGNIN